MSGKIGNGDGVVVLSCRGRQSMVGIAVRCGGRVVVFGWSLRRMWSGQFSISWAISAARASFFLCLYAVLWLERPRTEEGICCAVSMVGRRGRRVVDVEAVVRLCCLVCVGCLIEWDVGSVGIGMVVGWVGGLSWLVLSLLSGWSSNGVGVGVGWVGGSSWLVLLLSSGWSSNGVGVGWGGSTFVTVIMM